MNNIGAGRIALALLLSLCGCAFVGQKSNQLMPSYVRIDNGEVVQRISTMLSPGLREIVVIGPLSMTGNSCWAPSRTYLSDESNPGEPLNEPENHEATVFPLALGESCTIRQIRGRRGIKTSGDAVAQIGNVVEAVGKYLAVHKAAGEICDARSQVPSDLPIAALQISEIFESVENEFVVEAFHENSRVILNINVRVNENGMAVSQVNCENGLHM